MKILCVILAVVSLLEFGALLYFLHIIRLQIDEMNRKNAPMKPPTWSKATERKVFGDNIQRFGEEDFNDSEYVRLYLGKD